jgi:hypothetical protein
MKKVFLTLVAVATCLTACTTEPDDPVAPRADKITVSPTISLTRATDMNFEEGDRIGLTIIRVDESLHTENAMLTHDGEVFSGGAVWYSGTNEASHLVAYHPYDPSGAPATFTVSPDQRNGGYGRSDLMGAGRPDVSPSASPVGMVFKHLLTKINIDVTNETAADVTSVALQGVIPTADIDLKALRVEADDAASPTNITVQEMTKNKLYRAIVVPQQVAMTVVVKTSDGKMFSQTLAAATLKQGTQYKIDIAVGKTLKATLSGEISGWTDEGTIAPVEPEPEPEPGERLYTVTFEGDDWESFVVANFKPGATSTTDINNYTYPIWTDATTKLSTEYPSKGTGIGYDYSWMVSSYNTADIDTYGYFDNDLYVYNANSADNLHGGGRNGSDNFLVAFGYDEPDNPYAMNDGRPIFKFADGRARTIKSIWINSTTYFLSVFWDGNGLSPALAPGEEVWWSATGFDADGNETGTVTMIFAEHGKVVSEWTEWDLSSLGPIVTLKLNQGGGTDNGYGYSLPAYYAIDDVTVVME